MIRITMVMLFIIVACLIADGSKEKPKPGRVGYQDWPAQHVIADKNGERQT